MKIQNSSAQKSPVRAAFHLKGKAANNLHRSSPDKGRLGGVLDLTQSSERRAAKRKPPSNSPLSGGERCSDSAIQLNQFLLGFILLLAPPLAQAEGLGRLFFTPAQRAQLNSHHYLPTPAVTTPEVLADAPETGHSLTVNGIVQRSGGKRTAWINGAAKTVEQGDENPTSVMVNLPDQNKTVRLKVGQRITINPPASTNAENDAEKPAPTSDD